MLNFARFLLFVCLSFVSYSASAANPAALFVFDGSGSMWGQVDGKTKIELAKQAMTGLVRDFPADTDIGLVAYGHNKQSDCGDIETLAPVGSSKEAVIKAIESINPKGKTPLTKAIKFAAGQLKDRDAPISIVVVSDGKENCNGDPCAAAKAVHKAGVNLKIHVIGFDVKKDEAAQLQCIAKNGGGRYFAAGNASELTKSFAEVKKEVANPKKPVTKIIFKDDFDGEFLSDKWIVINPDEDNVVIEDGYLTVLLQPGWPSEGKTHNILLYSGDLPKNYEVTAKFKAEIIDFPNFRSWETQRIGLVFYSSKENFIELTTSTGGVSTGNLLQVAYGKYKKGKWLPGHSSNISKGAEQEFKIQRKGRKYAAFFKGAKGKWVEIGTYTDLKGKFKPGIMAYRAPNAKETTVEYDWFKIIGWD